MSDRGRPKFSLRKNQQGSTSVLMIVLMIVLTAFGLAALTTAYAGFRLSQRSNEYTKEYYILEGQAVKVEYDIYQIMLDSYESTAYPKEGVLGQGFDMFHSQVELAMNNYVLEAGQLIDVYFEKDFPEFDSDGNSRVGTLHYTVTSGGENPRNISVGLDLMVPKDLDDFALEQLLLVDYWYQWQEGVGQVNKDIFFDDPFDDPQFIDSDDQGM